MKSDKKVLLPNLSKVIHYVCVIILLLTLSLLIECVFFQRGALFHKEQPLTLKGAELKQKESFLVSEQEDLVKLSQEEQNAIRVQRENERLIAEYNGMEYEPTEDETLVEKDGVFYRKIIKTTINVSLDTPYFIKKLLLQIPLEEDGGYHVSLFKNGEKIKSGLFCSINAKIDAGVMNVHSDADALEIVLSTQDQISVDDLVIQLSNTFALNAMRVAFIFCLLVVLVTVLKSVMFSDKVRYISSKPEWVFAVCALGLGSLLICGIGTNQVGFDEYAHAKTAYDLSFGSTIETTEAAMQMKGNLLPYFNNPEERALVEAYEQKMVEEIAPDITHQSRMVRTETRVYYPMAAGFYLGRKLGVDFATSVCMAKFGNLLAYIAVMWLAIRLAKQYKLLVVLIGLLPNNIFIASSITYDAVVTSFLMLASVLMLNEILEPHQKLKWTNLLLMLFAFEIGCLSKPIYIVMAIMLVFFGKDKFENRLQEWICKLSVIAMAGLMLYNIFKPTPVAGGDYALVSNLSYAGDPRNTGASVTGQIGYIMNNPLAYTVLLLKSMGTMLWEYVSAAVPFVGYAYLGFAQSWVNWLCLLLALVAAIYTSRENQYYVREEEHNIFRRSAIGMKYIILNLIMCFGVTAIVWTSMYVSYTKVGADVIEGVQGRYFIPLFLPLFSCLFLRRSKLEKKWKIAKLWYRISPEMMYGILIGIMAILNLIMTWQFVITKLNV